MLCFTDRVCCEPLTPYMYFADLRVAQPEYMERLMAMLKALAALADDVCNELKVHLQWTKASRSLQRFKQLEDGIPYTLHDKSGVPSVVFGLSVARSSWLTGRPCLPCGLLCLGALHNCG